MKIDIKAGIYSVLIPAFFIYFFSEVFLRQAAVSNVDPQSVNIDSIITELPSSIKDSIRYKIQIGQLKDAVISASTDSERAQALCNYADALNDREEKEKILKEVMARYADTRDAVKAFIYFLNPETKYSIQIKDYHRFTGRFKQSEQYYIWSMGLAKLIELKADYKIKMDYLLPLLEIKPEYRNYSRLYDSLAEFSANLKENDIYKKAKAKEDACVDLPFIEDELDLLFKQKVKK